MRVLDGIRVLDFGRYLACPYAAMILGDMGAEVIRVEKPQGEDDRYSGLQAPDGTGLFYLCLARNKKSITLDLLKSRGRALLLDLLGSSDIIMHNFPPQVAERVGLAYEQVRAVDPRLILVSITGFSTRGRYANRNAFDTVAQAFAGSFHFTGFPGDPPTRAQVPYVDLSTGLSAALGAVLALRHREMTGEGQLVDQALVGLSTSFVAAAAHLAEYTLFGTMRSQIGNHTNFAYGDAVQAKDGWVLLTIFNNRNWQSFARLLGREDLASDPRFASDMLRYEYRDLIDPIVAAWARDRPVAEIVRTLEEAHIPCGPVNTVADLARDPHIREEKLVVEIEYPQVGSIPVTGIPVRLSATPGTIRRRPPLLGEHNEEVYCQLLGFSRAEFASLKEDSTI